MEIDLQPIKNAVAFAGDTGSAVGQLAKAAHVVQKLFGTAKMGADADVKMAVNDLMLQVANTKAANAQLIHQLAALETQIKEAQAKQADFDRYELWETPAGALVYRLKESDSTGEPSHCLCPQCMQCKRKSILQGARIAKCHVCNSRFPFEGRKPRRRTLTK